MTKKITLDDFDIDNLEDIKIEFMPGCFDSFDSTQEELDELVAEITRMIKSGEFIENSHEITIDDFDSSDDLYSSPTEIELVVQKKGIH